MAGTYRAMEISSPGRFTLVNRKIQEPEEGGHAGLPAEAPRPVPRALDLKQ